MFKKISEATDFIKEKIDKKPLVGIVTGTGLANITEFMEVHQNIPYEEIHYPHIELPEVNKEGYVRAPADSQTFVPDRFSGRK